MHQSNQMLQARELNQMDQVQEPESSQRQAPPLVLELNQK
jgi:hypothetical protein